MVLEMEHNERKKGENEIRDAHKEVQDGKQKVGSRVEVITR